MHVIEIHRLAKRYGDVTALAGIDFCIPAGAIFGFLGPNGAGKTTAMRILVGLLKPTAGRATVFGCDADRQSTDIRRRIGYLPGDVRFYERMTGTQLLRFCDAMRGNGAAAEIRRLQARFDLDLERRIRDYSRGMKQKLGLIQALMHRPELLILDEPTTALDPLVQHTLYDELRSVAAEGRTVLFSSHTLSEVELLCDRVAIIRRGRIIEDNTISELRTRAVRRVCLRLSNEVAEKLAVPPGAHLQSSHDGSVTVSWTGEAAALVSWLSRLDLLDVTVGPPNLEDLFTAYYRDDGDPGATGTQGQGHD